MNTATQTQSGFRASDNGVEPTDQVMDGPSVIAYSVRRRTLVQLLGLGIVSGFAGCLGVGSTIAEPSNPATVSPTHPSTTQPSTPDGPSTNHTRQVVFGQCSFSVRFTCETFEIEATPVDFPYYLQMTYRDTETDGLVRFTVGPLTGRIEDPFGETPFLLVEVLITVPGEGTKAVHIPRECVDWTGPLL